jgi:hypothetical protein
MPRSPMSAALQPWWRVFLLVIAAVLFADLCLRFHPTGFAGGGSDDQRYLDAALAWASNGPAPGTTHWALRHPLIISILAAFRLDGIGTDALLLVPRAFYALLVAVTAGALARFAGLRAAILWTLLIAASPVMHEMATSCFPEMLELALSAVSLWAFHAARSARSGRPALLLLSGAAAGIAFLTRETAAVLPLLYGIAFVLRPGMPRASYLWLGAGWLAPVAIDMAWLWQRSGDVLYRYHVDSGHVRIASAHLRGGVYQGSHGPLFNFDLASRWVPSGPLPIHWTIDPLVNLIIDPEFGLIFLAWILLGRWAKAGGSVAAFYRAHRPALLILAAASFVLTTWVLMLRPQPRYYLIATYAATIAVALLGAQALGDRALRRRTVAVLVALILVGGGTIALLHRDQQRPIALILPYVAAHPGRFYVNPKIAARLAFPLARSGMTGRVSDGPVPIGGLRIRVLTDKPFKLHKPIADMPGFVAVETTREPRPLIQRLLQSPTVAARPGLRIERRVF